MVAYITPKYFQFFNCKSSFQIYFLFSYFSKEFFSFFFLCVLRNFVRLSFSDTQSLWIFASIISASGLVTSIDKQLMFSHLLMFLDFIVFTLTPLLISLNMNDSTLYSSISFCILNFHLACLKLFSLCVCVCVCVYGYRAYYCSSRKYYSVKSVRFGLVL